MSDLVARALWATIGKDWQLKRIAELQKELEANAAQQQENFNTFMPLTNQPSTPELINRVVELGEQMGQLVLKGKELTDELNQLLNQ